MTGLQIRIRRERINDNAVSRWQVVIPASYAWWYHLFGELSPVREGQEYSSISPVLDDCGRSIVDGNSSFDNRSRWESAGVFVVSQWYSV